MWRLSLQTVFWIKKSRYYCRCATPKLTHVFDSPPIKCSLYPSGLILAHEERDCRNACIAITFDAGARYETEKENGVTHFFEHMCFKGTKTRSKTNIECEMNEIGGKFKCYTTREMVGFSAECLSENIPQALHLLTDCIFNNALSNSEVEIQKCVIYQEMLKHDKDSSSVLFDYLHTAAFQGIGLGQSVMGPTHNLYNFNATNITSYVQRMFVPSRMFFTCVGPIKQEQACNMANTFLNKSDPSPSICKQYRFTSADIRYRDDSMNVAHVVLALEAPSFQHADYLPMLLAATAIGSWDRSQPAANHSTYLAQAAASGICNSFESFYMAYSDTGLWGTQFVAPRMEVGSMLELLQGEWMKLCTTVTESELIKTKEQLKWKMLKQNESAAGACQDIARWVFYTNFAPTIREKFHALDRLVVDDVKRVCYDYIYNRCPVVVAMGATEALPLYSRLRGGMDWLRF